MVIVEVQVSKLDLFGDNYYYLTLRPTGEQPITMQPDRRLEVTGEITIKVPRVSGILGSPHLGEILLFEISRKEKK